jgi:hypothetical protein
MNRSGRRTYSHVRHYATQELANSIRECRKNTLESEDKTSDARSTRSWGRLAAIWQEIDGLLLRGECVGIGVVKELSAHPDWLWTFVNVEGVAPTNNASERLAARRHLAETFSFGTQIATRSRFVETILTLAETSGQQSRNVFDFVAKARLRDHHARRVGVDFCTQHVRGPANFRQAPAAKLKLLHY